MDQIFKIKDSLMGYLSPAAKRRKTMAPATPPVKATVEQRTTQAVTEPRNPKQKAVVAGRVNKKYLSPSDTRHILGKQRKRRYSDDEYLEDDDRSIGPEDSSSQILSRRGKARKSRAPVKQVEDVDAEPRFNAEEESELDAEAKVHQFLDCQSELARRQETQDIIRDGDWHEDEQALLEKLSMRGFEPLLPAHWSFDFRTCPSTIFSTNDDETFLNAQSGNNFRATTALQSLVTLGSRVRALIDCHKPQERLIKKELQNYIKWAERDGGYASKRYLPLLHLDAGGPREDFASIAKSITDQLYFLAVRHRQALAPPIPGQLNDEGEVVMFTKPPPVLYGLVISHCIVVVLTIDAAKVHAKPKTLAHFDFSDITMDVWNGFALAIVVCMVRNHLMAMRDEMESDDEDEGLDVDL